MQITDKALFYINDHVNNTAVESVGAEQSDDIFE
jgi:hypothetical protein